MIDERTIVSDLKSYVDELSGEGFHAEVEVRVGNQGRADLVVYYNDKILLNAEYKKPTVNEGKNPQAEPLVKDAFNKAHSFNPPSPFYVTSNFNETILFDNRPNSPALDRPYNAREIYSIILPPNVKITSEQDFNRDDVKDALRSTIQELVREAYNFKENKKSIPIKPLGDSFYEGLNAHLNHAVETAVKYVPDNILRKWWKEQGYEPVATFTDAEKRQIAKYSVYILANKIVFYYVLKRWFTLPEIKIPDSGKIKDLEAEVSKRFEQAKKASGDYETVFEHTIADEIPFRDDELFYPISALIEFLKDYNFSKLSQDVLGNIYDRLLSPDERHNYGQYYTPIPVVDLINALTIKDADAVVLDPACGSGTFLSRAFDLKLKLKGQDDDTTRETLLNQIFGVEIASYPAHLATIALASKLLKYNPKFYPNIIRGDFLNVKPEEVKPKWGILSTNSKTTDLSGIERKVVFKPIDAVVGNLPYIRQEQIENKEEKQKNIEVFLKQNGFGNYRPNNTSDFHVYFWYYVLPFLREGSRVGFLTSDTWLNIDYGDDLKKFINDHFKIVAVIDSVVERWFEDALVNTIITILERTENAKERKNNKIKFVRIHRKISELIKNLDDACRIAENIEAGKSSGDVEVVREVKQGDIDFNDKIKAKMFPYLRAPKEFFDLIALRNMIPLKQIMDVKFGIKTGANEFFYVEDVTDSYTDKELFDRFRLRPGETERLRIIRSGDGTEHIIEREYLKPVLKSPKEFTVNGSLVFSGVTKKRVVLITETDKNKIKPHAKEYIEYGEKNPPDEPYSNRPTCKVKNPWWKLSPIIYPDLVFAALFSSTFVYPKTNVLLDAAMYFGKMKDEYRDDLLAVYSFMNSSLSYLYPDFLGRNYGGGGAPVNFKVYEVQELPVPKPEIMRPYYKKIEEIMAQMEKRRIGSVFEEIWDLKGTFSLDKVKSDRLELDRVILKALGFPDPDAFLEKWYVAVVKTVKERLDKAKSLGSPKSSRKVSLERVAEEILERVDIKEFPQDYIKPSMIKETIKLKAGNRVEKGHDLPGYFTGKEFFVSVDGEKTYFESEEYADYVYFCAMRGLRDIPIPHNIEYVLELFNEDLETWRTKLDKEIRDITGDEKYREKLRQICARKKNYEGILWAK